MNDVGVISDSRMYFRTTSIAALACWPRGRVSDGHAGDDRITLRALLGDGGTDDIIAKLIQEDALRGRLRLHINNFNVLPSILFRSFAGWVSRHRDRLLTGRQLLHRVDSRSWASMPGDRSLSHRNALGFPEVLRQHRPPLPCSSWRGSS